MKTTVLYVYIRYPVFVRPQGKLTQDADKE